MTWLSKDSKIYSVLRANALGIGILLLAWVIFFSPLLFQGQIYFLDDLKIIFYPLEQAYGEFQRQGELPEWSPYFGFGHPLIAWGQLGFFTPLHVLLRLTGMHALILLQVSIMSYFLIGLLGFYAFLRTRLFSQAASALGASLFVFSGFHIGHLNHINFFTSSLLLPWLLLAAYLLIKKPTIHRGLALTVISAAVVLSGQPQVILYTFIIAAIISLALFFETYWPQLRGLKGLKSPLLHAPIKVIIYTAMAGILAFGLSSFAILPLAEFLPQTERGATIPVEQLLEFSYPPSHAITLALPYFFGDHETYWGAKGFQELAAFTGILPLFLAGAALSSWKTRRTERILGIILIGVGIIMAMGKYSPLYYYLVQNHIITSLNIPGRFVYFFITGVALLATAGLSDIATLPLSSKGRRISFIATGAALIAILAAPFFIYIQTENRAFAQFMSLFSVPSVDVQLTILGILGLIVFAFLAWQKEFAKAATYAFTILSISTLVVFAFNYNPRIDRDLAFASSPISTYLKEYSQTHSTPGRLYAHSVLLRDVPDQTIRKTDPISPDFTVHQPVFIEHNNVACLNMPLRKDENISGTIQVDIKESIDSAPLRSISLAVSSLSYSSNHDICFDPIDASAHKQFIVSFSSQYHSGVSLLYHASENDQLQAFLVRKAEPTPEELERSRKAAQIFMEPLYDNVIDTEIVTLARHIQATHHTSSARWIGALSIKPYREFIEAFFANDGEVIDGDGMHAIQRNREILNMAGVTHLIQPLPIGSIDGMPAESYIPITSIASGQYTTWLYENPDAFPKAFMVPNGTFVASADEIRFIMKSRNFSPEKEVFISGPTPPEELPPVAADSLTSSVTITRYEPKHIEVSVQTSHDAYLVVTDSTTEQWTTYIDGKKAPYYVANSVFKTALVPEGDHIVSFKYESRAIENSKKLTLGSLLITGILAVVPYTRRKSDTPLA